MARPIIALLTDFGTRDHYVAAMKAVMLGIARDVTLVDITHEIPPQDILSAALELAACCRDFPPETIFLIVVDPGVGTSRRAIAARAGDRFFVAPDNGVLAPVLARETAALIVELAERRYARPDVSRTFEGRDRFAPAAAWLAAGADIRAFGPVVAAPVSLPIPEPKAYERAVAGVILKTDRFGNLISNIDQPLVERVSRTGTPVVRVGTHTIDGIVSTYGVTDRGAICALVGSGGYLEVAASGDSAGRLLGLGRGAPIVLAADRRALDAVDEIGEIDARPR